MYCAIGGEPTKLNALTSGCSRRPSTAILSPCTTLKTPGGRPASWKRLAMYTEADGSRSLGFNTKVLAQAIATGYIQDGTMHGKLNGVIPATTPRGCRRVQLSIPVETWSVKSPFSSCG